MFKDLRLFCRPDFVYIPIDTLCAAWYNVRAIYYSSAYDFL